MTEQFHYITNWNWKSIIIIAWKTSECKAFDNYSFHEQKRKILFFYPINTNIIRMKIAQKLLLK